MNAEDFDSRAEWQDALWQAAQESRDVAALEAAFTVSEALNCGLFVAEVLIGDEVVRSYGWTADQAEGRLLAELGESMIVRHPVYGHSAAVIA